MSWNLKSKLLARRNLYYLKEHLHKNVYKIWKSITKVRIKQSQKSTAYLQDMRSINTFNELDFDFKTIIQSRGLYTKRVPEHPVHAIAREKGKLKHQFYSV